MLEDSYEVMVFTLLSASATLSLTEHLHEGFAGKVQWAYTEPKPGPSRKERDYDEAAL